MNEIQAYFDVHIKLGEAHDLRNNPGVFFQLLKDECQEFQSVPWSTWKGRGYRKGAQGNCFSNATNLMLRHKHELSYVEGYGYTGVMPIHHAWCVDERGRVIDSTWRENEIRKVAVEDWQYLGISFDWEYVAKTVVRQGVFGILETYITELIEERMIA